MKWLFFLLWPLTALAQTVMVTWDMPPEPYQTWYVVCVSATSTSSCIPFTYFPSVSGFAYSRQFTFDEKQLNLPMGSGYCIRVAAVKYGSWPWMGWSNPLCTTYNQ